MPPYLAGREKEISEFKKLLSQTTILQNLVLTGLRGIGKTVLLETFKPVAIQSEWLWAGTDLSEASSVSEDNLVIRILTDLSMVTSSIVVSSQEKSKIGFGTDTSVTNTTLTFPILKYLYDSTPGLAADKLKAVFEFVWPYIKKIGKCGIIFAYDEAQNLADYAAKEQYPFSLLLDVFQSIQRKEIPFMLVLTGLPTLFPKLVETRTYSERMFHLIFLDPLSREETIEAVNKPLKSSSCPILMAKESVEGIWKATRGYPYFIQYVCREVYDIWIQSTVSGNEPPTIPLIEIINKLDADFFAGRWARATDRQRDLLYIIAQLPSGDEEFTVQEIMANDSYKQLTKQFSSSHINQMLASLADNGLVYKNRHGKYSFAVPLLGEFIKRQSDVTK